VIARFCPGNIVADTVMRALAPLVPDNVSAGVGNLKVVAYSGLLPGGQHWVYMDIQEGSYGGRPGKDGLDAVDTLYANTRNNPIEDIESHYPLRVTRYELNVNTGGPGRWRGGLGTVREIEFLAPGGMSLEGDGSVYPPPGLFGGGDGTPGQVEINHRGEDGLEVPSKFPYRAARAGDRLLLIAPSGGGYGPPSERDPAAIGDDIADGVLSRERARELYGFEQ
jgi:N-methylhydantoinase B